MIMGNKPAYPPWPHSVCLPEGLAGGCAPSDPGVSGHATGADGVEVLHPPNPIAWATGERSRVVADVILDTISRELGLDQRGLEDPPWVGPLADGWRLIQGGAPPRSPENRSHGRSGPFGGRFGGTRGRGIASNARTRPSEG